MEGFMLPKPKNGLHRHHIIPKHVGGKDNPTNIIYLTVENHALAHKELWKKYGLQEDYIAWKALSSQISNKDATRMAIIASNKKRKVSEETKRKIGNKSKGRQSKLNYKTSEETKQKIRESVLKTFEQKDYRKDYRKRYRIQHPSGKIEFTDNIEKYCNSYPNIPSANCIRTQHHRGKTTWLKGKYKGFVIDQL
jgi:hypothetical protein